MGRFLVLNVAFAMGCLTSDSEHSEEMVPEEFQPRWGVAENNCTCPGLGLFFDEGALFTIEPNEGPLAHKICWVEGPHHPDLMGCYGAEIEGKQITIDLWDPGCASTPCDGTLSEDGTSIVASCSEGLVGETCNVVLSAQSQ